MVQNEILTDVLNQILDPYRQQYLCNLGEYVIAIKNTWFIDKNGFIDTSLYPSEDFTILDVCFTCLFIIVLTAITGRIIDKKLEI